MGVRALKPWKLPLMIAAGTLEWRGRRAQGSFAMCAKAARPHPTAPISRYWNRLEMPPTITTSAAFSVNNVETTARPLCPAMSEGLGLGSVCGVDCVPLTARRPADVVAALLAPPLASELL